MVVSEQAGKEKAKLSARLEGQVARRLDIGTRTPSAEDIFLHKAQLFRFMQETQAQGRSGVGGSAMPQTDGSLPKKRSIQVPLSPRREAGHEYGPDC